MSEIPDTLEIIRLDSPAWMARASCAGHDPEDWYSDPEDPVGNEERRERAVAVCETCPVRAECLEWAYETGDGWAILGALTANKRKRVRRTMQHEIMLGLGIKE
jgi:WhiB family redox-sensing transcriptional regulator